MIQIAIYFYRPLLRKVFLPKTLLFLYLYCFFFLLARSIDRRTRKQRRSQLAFESASQKTRDNRGRFTPACKDLITLYSRYRLLTFSKPID